MRMTLLDGGLRHPAEWFLEWPPRRLRYWSLLLFEKGQGWLRWGKDERTLYQGYMEPPEGFTVAPPLRRFAWGLRYLFSQLFNVHGLRTEAGWEWPWTYNYAYRDPDRLIDLGYDHLEPRVKRRRKRDLPHLGGVR